MSQWRQTAQDIMPALSWLPNYQRTDLRGDLIAGITVAMMLIPQAMSYAMLAGLPPYVGLYASVVPLILYALFGTSRQLAVGPVAMVALLVASGVGPLAEMGSELYVALAILLALMVGVIQLGMGLLRLGFLTNFLSHPVISGFTSAAALVIGFSQLQHLIGVSLPRTENIALLLWSALERWTEMNVATLVIGLGSVVALLVLKRINPLWPGAMVVVVLSTLAVWLLNLDTRYGVAIVGSVPAGFPEFSVPMVNAEQVVSLLPIAITISFIGFIESIAVAKKIAAEKRYDVDPNRELVGLGLANLGAAFFKAMPVTGGFSRTAVNRTAGANTGLASIITAVLIGIALLVATPLFFYIPTAALAAVIMVAVVGLIDTHEVKHLWVVNRSDLVMLIISFAATLILGVKVGIFVAVIASTLWFVIRTTRPHYAVLGKLPEYPVYKNIKRHAGATTTPGILAIRFDAQFYYGNVTFLKDTLRNAEAHLAQPLHAVVLDASAINQLDSSADTSLHELLDDFEHRGIALHLSGLKGPVFDVMVASGFLRKLGEDHVHLTTELAMAAAKAKLT